MGTCHYPLPGVTAAQIVAAGAVPLRVAGQLGGQPQQGKLAQHGQVPDPEPAAQRRFRFPRRVDVAASHPVTQSLRRQVHQLDLMRRADDRIRHGLPERGAGDLLDYVGQGIQVPDTDGRDHVDTRLKQVLDVLPPRGVTPAWHVAVCELIHQCHLGPAGQHRGDVHLLRHRAPVWHPGRRNDLQTRQQRGRTRPAMSFRMGHHHVGALLRAPTALAKQRAGRAGTRRIAQVDPQPPPPIRGAVRGTGGLVLGRN